LANPEICDKVLPQIMHYYDTAIDPQFESPELLYGRVGFLAMMIQLWKKLGTKALGIYPTFKNQISHLMDIILIEGARNADAECPLVWSWHKKKYWGAAHGSTGILFIFLSGYEEFIKGGKWEQPIKTTIEFLGKAAARDGNFPSRKDGGTSLVQWCHGPPALIFTLCQAYKIWGTKEFLAVAEKAGEVVWKEGLLVKGPGLCHGVSGNAYAFLTLYNATNNPIYIWRAVEFIHAYFTPEYQSFMSKPDSPYSLYGGLSGMACLLIDILNDPKQARFPFYEDIGE